jgi:hypothetical protein
MSTQTPIQMELLQKMQKEVKENERPIWHAFPDSTHRAKQIPGRMTSPPWLVLRLILLVGVLLVFIATSVVYHTASSLVWGYGAILLIAILVVVGVVLWRRHIRLMRLSRTLYAITTGQRLLVLTLDRDQLVQNSYYAQDLGRIDLVERSDGWGDIVIGGQQRLQSTGYSISMTTPRLIGIEHAREVSRLLTQLQSEQLPPQ